MNNDAPATLSAQSRHTRGGSPRNDHIPPGPRGVPLVGNALHFRRDPLGFLTRAAREHGDTVRLTAGRQEMLFINHPALLESVLATNARRFTRSKSKPPTRLDYLLAGGEDVYRVINFPGDEDFWVRERHRFNPLLKGSALARYGPTMVRMAERHISTWQQGEIVEVHREMGRLSLDIVLNSLYGADYPDRRDEIGDLSAALNDLTTELFDRMDAIERFAADVSHELKNPLSSLRSAVETAARIDDAEKQKRLMAVIEQDVDRLDRLITDIANASRLDAELARLAPEPVDLRQLLQTLAEVYRTTAKDGAPEIRLDLPERGSLIAQAVEDRLVQVLQNLIANAVSFTPPQGAIRIAALAEKNTVTVTVEDDGPGIAPGKEEDIFKRFYSERPADEAFGQHSGLGLSISRQIVEALGGALRAENIRMPDGSVRGARFVISLPRLFRTAGRPPGEGGTGSTA